MSRLAIERGAYAVRRPTSMCSRMKSTWHPCVGIRVDRHGDDGPLAMAPTTISENSTIKMKECI